MKPYRRAARAGSLLPAGLVGLFALFLVLPGPVFGGEVMCGYGVGDPIEISAWYNGLINGGCCEVQSIQRDVGQEGPVMTVICYDCEGDLRPDRTLKKELLKFYSCTRLSDALKEE